MKVLKTIKSENVISIDIETVRVVEDFYDLDEGTQSAWEYKNKQDGVVPPQEVLSELWKKNASLYAEFSRICAVSIAFLHEDVLYCREFFGEDEEEILKSLHVSLENIYTRSQQEGKVYRLCGHAAKYFDYPFLAKRYIINSMEIPNILDVTSLKPWEQSNLCTNELWKLGGTGAGSSLQALCNVLNVPTSKVDLVGDEVGTAYYKKEFEKIGRYCSYDAVATYNVFRRFKGEHIFQFDEVVYKQAIEKKKEATWLEKLYLSKVITDESREEIQRIFKKKRLLKKDKEAVLDIIKSALCEIDPNFGKITNEKAVIEELKQLSV